MENDLDEIAEGTQESLPWLSRFYFGVRGRRPTATGRTTATRPSTREVGSA